MGLLNHEDVRVRVYKLIIDIMKQLLKEERRERGSPHSPLVLHLLKLSKDPVHSVALVRQEVPVCGHKVDMVFGWRAFFEFKSEVNEFSEAFEKAKEYLQCVREARHYIVTNFRQWEIFEVTQEGDLKPVREFEKNPKEVREELKKVISNALGAIAESLDVKIGGVTRKSGAKGQQYYVIYGRSRPFYARVSKNPSVKISSSGVLYIKCRSREQAYYYAAVLNYLVYKALEKGKEPVGGQSVVPLLAIDAAGLSWHSVPSECERQKVANQFQELLKKIAQKRCSRIEEEGFREELSKVTRSLSRSLRKCLSDYRLESALSVISEG